MNEFVISSLVAAQSALERLIGDEASTAAITTAGHTLGECIRKGGRIFSCGNGGSMCDAMHFAEELSGRYRKDRRALAATAISDPSHLTCVANDYGYDFVFSRYLESQARPGDCLLAISTSGNSKTVLNAANTAKAMGLTVIGLYGRRGSLLESALDIGICTPAGEFADRVQELHIKVIHILIELIERQLFPENYDVA